MASPKISPRPDRGVNTSNPHTGLGASGNDGFMEVTVTVKLAGTPTQIAADFATLAGTSFTATSAVIDWRRS